MPAQDAGARERTGSAESPEGERRRRLAALGRPEGETELSAPFLQQFEELGLTDAQRERVRQVVAHRRPQADSIMRQVRAGVLELEQTMREELACILTPDQQRRWLDWRREHGYSVGEAEQWLRRARTSTCPPS